MNPHNYLKKIDWEKLIWKCQYCGVIGTIEELDKIECSYQYPPCRWCGQTPICASDCIGIRIALSDPRIYIAGNKDWEDLKEERMAN